MKQSGGSEGVFVNGVLSAARTQTSKFTAYVSPYLVVSTGGNYSKHIYVGSQRITSKLSNSQIFSEAKNPLTIAKAKAGETVDYTAKFNTLTEKIAERFDSLGVIYKGAVQSGGLTTQGSPSGVTPQYFYHPDHLGSSSLITDENGLMVQHIQYVPFGEVFVEERTTSWSTPYKFNAKELDPETGLYYYGARYYDPRTSVWLSVDPLAEKYPNISSYVYCAENPVKYVDPDGQAVLIPNGLYGAITSMPILKATVTKQESSFIRLNSNGFINPVMMQLGAIFMGNDVSGNCLALLEIVLNEKIVEFSAPLSKTANDVNGNSVATKDMAFQFKNPVSDEYNDYVPTLEGGIGITLAPSTHQWPENDRSLKEQLPPEQQYYSTNGNYQVQVNGRGLTHRRSFGQLVLAAAHELYGHLLLMFRGKDSLHSSSRSGNGANTELENQIKDRVNEAEQNLNSR